MNKFFRIAAVLLAVVLVLTGCTKPAYPSDHTTPVETNPAETTAVPTEPTVPVGTSEPAEDASLNSFRQAMIGTTELFAVAYLGYQDIMDSDEPVDPIAVLQEEAPRLCADLPFLTEIQQVIGENGDLFCIVPASEDAQVTVSKAVWNEAAEDYRFETVIYQGRGEPFFVFCNNAGMEPDTEVRIASSDGEAVWYPRIDGNQCPEPLENDNWEPLFRDFTPYRERLAHQHENMKGEWALPTAGQLIDTDWECTEYPWGGNPARYLVKFRTDTLYIRWNDGIDRMDHELHDVPWSLTQEQDYAVLTIDLGELGGVMRYNVLYHKDYDELYIAQDAVQEPGNIGWEPTHRFLSRAVPGDREDLAGTWELIWSEVEGYQEEAEPGRMAMEIFRSDNGLWYCTLTDREDQARDFYEKELMIFPFEMDSSCENQEWVAALNYTPKDGSDYHMTLIYGDLLQVMVTWPQDGYTACAMLYFRPAVLN